MGAGHAHPLYRDADSPVHHLPAHGKLLAVVAFVLLVVATPREQFAAFGLDALLLAGVAVVSQVPFGFLARRALVEVPFLLFAVLLPFFASGPRVALPLLGVHVSSGGLLAAFNILAKGTLGVLASLLLAATTELRHLISGLSRLRLPALLVQIMRFTLRYTDVVSADAARMRVARASRGFAARDVRQLPVLAKSAGALFIRSYERGERVHLAMLSRGYDGTMQATTPPTTPTRGQWAMTALLPVAAALACALAWLGTWLSSSG